jgi:hypothetical protein
MAEFKTADDYMRVELVRKLRALIDRLESDPGAYFNYEYSEMPITSEPRLTKLSVWLEMLPPTSRRTL